MMGLLDNPDFAEELLKKALEQYKAKDSGSPMTSGLLSAGLGILAANNGRNAPMSAIGMGGLQGLGAYQQAKQAQQKDPMALLQMAQAAQGFQQNAMNQRAMQDFQGALNPRPMPPQSDYAPGEAQGPQTPPMAPPQMPQQQSGPPPLDVLMKFANSPNQAVAQRAMETIKTFYPQFELGVGAQRYGNNGQMIAQNVDSTKPVMQGGRAMVPPGAPEALAQLTAAQEQAKAAAQAQYQPVQTQQGGVPVTITAAQLAAQQTQPQGVDPRMAAAFSDYLKNGGAAQGAFRYTPPPDSGQIGRGISKAEEAAQTKAATSPLEIQQGAQTGANTDFITNEFRPTMTQGQMAKKALASLDVLDNQKITTGWGTTAKVYGARVLEGIGMAPDKAKELANDATVFNQVLQNETFRKLTSENKGPATERDADRAMQTYSQLTNPAQANQFIRDISRAQHNQDIAKAKFYSQNYAEALKSGDTYALEQKWQAQQKSVFDDPAMKKWAVQEAPQKEKSGAMAAPVAGPPPGAVVDGYKFKGGDPKKRESWEKQ